MGPVIGLYGLMVVRLRKAGGLRRLAWERRKMFLWKVIHRDQEHFVAFAKKLLRAKGLLDRTGLWDRGEYFPQPQTFVRVSRFTGKSLIVHYIWPSETQRTYRDTTKIIVSWTFTVMLNFAGRNTTENPIGRHNRND